MAAIKCFWPEWLVTALVSVRRALTVAVVFDAMTVILSSFTVDLIIDVGVRETFDVRFKLSATCISAPTCQNPAGN